MASDGLWDMLSNEEVRDVLAHEQARGMKAQELSDLLMREVKWRVESYPTLLADNTSIVVLHFSQAGKVTLNLQSFIPQDLTPTASWRTDSTHSGSPSPSISSGIAFSRTDTPLLEDDGEDED